MRALVIPHERAPGACTHPTGQVVPCSRASTLPGPGLDRGAVDSFDWRASTLLEDP